MPQYEVYSDKPTEIVIGIIGPLGTNTGKIRKLLCDTVKRFEYNAELIQVSDVIIPMLYGKPIPEITDKYKLALKKIECGNYIRKKSKNKAIMAIAAAVEINRIRKSNRKSQVVKNNKSEHAHRRNAYIISSLKRPEEVEELRKIYGQGFYLFAVHADKSQRIKYLVNQSGMSASNATDLIEKDEYEAIEYGQDIRSTFHRADFFLADEDNDDKLKSSIDRCVDLIFGCPHATPTFNEYAMFMAFAASVRSADLSRQVGAVVAKGNEITSTGANDCPAPGGGLYWPQFIGNRIDDVPRGRDYKRGYDSNTFEQNKIIESIASKFPTENQHAAKKILKESQIKDLTEYGRVVHAEMEALLACARKNESCIGATMYCTTFPCHNCAKHIIAAGINQVIYVEPYPKSKALEFHDDATLIDKPESDSNHVRFKPFIGVGSRLFFDLFSVSLSSGSRLKRKNKEDGTAVKWNRKKAMPRVQLLPVAYPKFETSASLYIKRYLLDPEAPK